MSPRQKFYGVYGIIGMSLLAAIAIIIASHLGYSDAWYFIIAIWALLFAILAFLGRK